MDAYLFDWLHLLLRWLHVIAGIAWIGASFYFVMLDNSLKPPKDDLDRQRGVHGELWAVHGGGFYQSRKYLTGPKGEPLSDDLHWSKWEAYTTWLSGMALLVLIYWFGARAYLIDQSVMELTPLQAIGISAGVLIAGWLVYDFLCKTLAQHEHWLMALMLAWVLFIDWALFQLFSARAAYLHVGAMLGTMMAANVAHYIIPGQRKMVAEIRAGREPDPTPGIIGKQRSVHNTYFTLPVLFIMISNHFPMTYGNPHGWLVLGVIMVAGVLIRQFFVLRHRGIVKPMLPIAGCLLLAAVAVAIVPRPATPSKTASPVTFEQVQPIFLQRCAPCHSPQPTQAGFAQPPKGILLDSPEHIRLNAAQSARTVSIRYMPLGNLTGMTDTERDAVKNWAAGQLNNP